MAEEISRTSLLGAKLVHEAMKVIVEKGGQAPSRDVVNEVGKRVALDEWATFVYEKTGYVRWKSILYFFTIGLTKAGFLVKKKGVWYVTPEGEAALKLTPLALSEKSKAAYTRWRDENPKADGRSERAAIQDDNEVSEYQQTETAREATLEEMQETAAEGIRQRIFSLNAYQFQDLVAALLRAMGYFTPFIAPRGKDGGVDIVAYQDPLGAVSPRIKLQVKHRQNNPATVQEVRELVGLLGKAGDVGMFVSSGGFTSDARQQARNTHVHVELIDLERLIDLWQDFYPKMDDEEKEHLRLRPVYFYDPVIE